VSCLHGHGRASEETKGRIPFANKLLVALLLLGTSLYAQNNPGQLGTEIQAIEQTLSKPGVSSAERHDALARLAKLRQLSGNIAEAAAHWLDAAAADPSDAAALTSGAYCLAAIGEWDRAALALRPLLASGRAGPVMLQAWFLDACLRAWSAADVSALTALAAHPDFATLRPLIYYTLWQTIARNPAAAGAGATAESWKTRLLAEFPQSPEARAVNPGNEKDSLAVNVVQSPLWQLLPGKAIATAPSAAPAPVAPAAPAPKPAAPVAPTPATTSSDASAVVLQTGLFSKEANARAQSDALRKAGFTAVLSRKLVNGAECWVVAVPAGSDQRKTTADLKKAGFDSFPVK